MTESVTVYRSGCGFEIHADTMATHNISLGAKGTVNTVIVVLITYRGRALNKVVVVNVHEGSNPTLWDINGYRVDENIRVATAATALLGGRPQPSYAQHGSIVLIAYYV